MAKDLSADEIMTVGLLNDKVRLCDKYTCLLRVLPICIPHPFRADCGVVRS